MEPSDFAAEIWSILGPIPDDAFAVMAASPASADAIEEVAERVGFGVPEGFARFSARTNGLCVVARSEVWPEAELYSVGPAWTFWRGVTLLGFETSDLPDWASVGHALDEMLDMGIEDLMPFMKVLGDGDRLWAIDAFGGVVLVSDGEIEPLGMSLTEAYAQQINELVARAQQIQDDRKR